LLLCTDSYKIEDVVKLINILLIKYDVNCTINYHKKIYPRIYILKKDLDKVRKIVLPYMHKSMLYKLGIKKKRELTEWFKVISLKLI
jgi:hypothetical protein